MENEKHDFDVEKHVNKKVLPSPGGAPRAQTSHQLDWLNWITADQLD